MLRNTDKTISKWDYFRSWPHYNLENLVRCGATHWSEDAPTAPSWRPSQPERAAKGFAERLLGEQQPCPPDIKKAINTHLMDLIDPAPSSPSPVTQSAKPDERALVRLESDLRSIKDDANENGAGNPPDGYGYLDQNSQAIADACFRLGLDSMETALSNWIYDQRNLAPAPSTPEGLRDTERLNKLEALIGRHVMTPCHKSKERPNGLRRDSCRSDIHISDDVQIYIRDDSGSSIEQGAGTTLRAAIDAIPFIPASTTEGRK